MNLIDFSAFEQAIHDKNMDKSALDEDLANHIIDELVGICFESLRSGDHAALKTVSQSKKSLESFLQEIERSYGSICWVTSTQQIFDEVAWDLMHESKLKSLDLGPDYQCVSLIKESFELYSNPLSLMNYLSLDSIGPSFYKSYAALFNALKWSDQEIATLYALGAVLDTEKNSFMHYARLPQHILVNPILAGMNREFALYDTTHKEVNILPDEIKSNAYDKLPAHSIIYCLIGQRLKFLEKHNGKVDADRRKDLVREGTDVEFHGEFYSEYVKYVHELVAYTLSLSEDVIENGAIKDRDLINSIRISVNTAVAIDDVIKIIASEHDRREPHEYAFGDIHGETDSRYISPKDLIDNILLEAQIYKFCAKRINDLALSNFNESQQGDFLDKFGSLFSPLDFNGRVNLKDDIEIKTALREAFSTYDFSNVKSLALNSVKRGIYPGLGPLVGYAPINIVKDVILSTETLKPDNIMMNHLISNFLCRCDANKRHLSNKFTNLHMEALVSFFAYAERREPGFGKDVGVSRYAEKFWLDQSSFLARYDSLVNAEKQAILDSATAVGEEDMTFLLPPSI